MSRIVLLFVHFWLTLVELLAYLLICRNRASIIRKTRVNRNWPRTHTGSFWCARIQSHWLGCGTVVLLNSEKDRKKTVPFKLKMLNLVRAFHISACFAVRLFGNFHCLVSGNKFNCVRFFSRQFLVGSASFAVSATHTQTHLMGRCICDFVVFFLFAFRCSNLMKFRIQNNKYIHADYGQRHTVLRNDERRTPNTRWLHKHIKYPAGRAQKRRARKRKIVHNNSNCNKSPFARRRNCCHSSSRRYCCRCWCRRRRCRRSA